MTLAMVMAIPDTIGKAEEPVLFDQHCVPCTGGEKGLSTTEIESHLKAVPEWQLVKDGKAISRRFKFKNFVDALAFVNKVGQLAEAEQHHPDILLGWGYAEIAFHTHTVGGLHLNDFIMAAKVDGI